MQPVGRCFGLCRILNDDPVGLIQYTKTPLRLTAYGMTKTDTPLYIGIGPSIIIDDLFNYSLRFGVFVKKS